MVSVHSSIVTACQIWSWLLRKSMSMRSSLWTSRRLERSLPNLKPLRPRHRLTSPRCKNVDQTTSRRALPVTNRATP